MSQLGLLAEYESHTWYSVGERERGYCNGIVIIDNSLVSVDDVEFEVKRPLAAEEIEHSAKQFGTFLEDVDSESAPFALQRHGGDKT